MIPLGLSVMQDSERDAATAELLASLHQKVQQLSDTQLATGTPQLHFYYDRLGREVSSQEAIANAEAAVYEAELQLQPLPVESLPGLSDSSQLRAIQVVVSSRQSDDVIARHSFHRTPMD